MREQIDFKKKEREKTVEIWEQLQSHVIYSKSYFAA
jgi:hypothetical protein